MTVTQERESDRGVRQGRGTVTEKEERRASVRGRVTQEEEERDSDRGPVLTLRSDSAHFDHFRSALELPSRLGH
jgi:hypothetical protein